MSTIIYLHGFASTGISGKSDLLLAEFGSDSVLRPDLPIDPDQTVQLINSLVHQVSTYPVIFVGTSLGGFWANYFAQKFDAPCVIVNPSVSPDLTMANRVGMSLSNYKTGEDISITNDIVQKFKKYKEEAEALYNGALVNVFLAENDEVIDYNLAKDYFKFNRSMTITPTGGHRYDKEWQRVITKLKELTKETT